MENYDDLYKNCYDLGIGFGPMFSKESPEMKTLMRWLSSHP